MTVMNRVFTLSILLCVIGTFIFAIMTIISSISLSQVDYSSYISFSDTLECNKVYDSDEYKITHRVRLNNHILEKFKVDMIFNYVDSYGVTFSKVKSINVSRDKYQDIVVYFYREHTVTLSSVSIRVSSSDEYTVMFKDSVYDEIYPSDYYIATLGNIQQCVILMAIFIILLVLVVVIYLIARQMYTNSDIPKSKRSVSYERNRSNKPNKRI